MEAPAFLPVATAGAGPQQHENPIYQAKIVQNPRQAKALGFKQLYGSFIDPPLCVCIPFDDGPRKRERMSNPAFLCHIRLVNSETLSDCCLLIDSSDNNSNNSASTREASSNDKTTILQDTPTPYRDNMNGPRQMSGKILIDPADGVEKLFFIFSEIRIRTVGTYRFVCTVMDCSRTEAVESMELVSDAFKVISPREFPGNLKATKLSKSFILQGVLFMGRSR